MAISNTYSQLVLQIADELGDRTDLIGPAYPDARSAARSPIKRAIQSAISKWEREPFYFNSIYAQNLFSTVASQELYATSGDSGNLLGTSPDLIKLHILVSNNRYPLYERTWSYLEDTSVNPSVTGQPTDYAYYAETMRLYPIPDNAYPITISGTQRFTQLLNDTDANPWTEDGYDLIRCEAQLVIAREVLHDDELVTRMETAIYGRSSAGGAWGNIPMQRGYYQALKAETTRRSKGKIIPSYFSVALAVGLVPLLCHLAI